MINPIISEWLNLIARWVHVFAGIMWIGTTYYFTFFFQAKDGIRDDLVTGVQTCALPIFRAEPVTAKQNLTAKEPIAFAFKNELGWQLHHFEPVLGKPTLEMAFFAPPFLVAEAAENESPADHQPCVRGKHQVRQTRLGRQQIDLATERSERVAQRLPLDTCEPWFCIPRPAHPRIDLVFNAVVIRRAEQQPAH